MLISPTTENGIGLPVLLVTVVFIMAGVFISPLLLTAEPYLVLGMMLLLGLPHGATDYGLFLALKGEGDRSATTSFYGIYLGSIALYGLVWYLFPLAALGVFVLLSVYHFGQSNWVHVRYERAWLARVHYLVWGAGVLLMPILLHAGEAIRIIATMTSIVLPAPSPTLVTGFIIGAAIVNGMAIIGLRIAGAIQTRRAALELAGYGLLTMLFLTNSLLLGFTVYFVFWHSLSSAHDQIQFFDRKLSPIHRRKVFLHIGATVVGALVFCLVVWFGPGAEATLRPSVIGGVFIAISLLTLPHMLLVERLYATWSPLDKQPTANEAEPTLI